MVSAFNKLGFPSVQLLPHRTWVRSGAAEVFCYQSRHVDSALAVRTARGTVLNINDCALDGRDLGALKTDIGEIDILLNQFSIAGFDGVEEALPEVAAGVLDDMVAVHRALAPSATIPFASLMYFCAADNRFINAYANAPRTVAQRFASEGLSLTVLGVGERHILGEARENDAALDRFDAQIAAATALPAPPSPVIDIDHLRAAFETMSGKIRCQHGLAGHLLRPVTVSVTDLGETIRLDFARGRFRSADGPADLEIASQPLHFLLSNTFGLQTLGVSGRYRLRANGRNWFAHRALFAMLNAGLGLSLRRALSSRQIAYFWRRRRELWHQSRSHIANARHRATA